METSCEPIRIRPAAPLVRLPAGWRRAARLGLLLAAPLSLPADTITWDGGGDGTSWSDPLNWSTDALPGQTDDVVIDVASDPTIVLSGSVEVRSLNCEEALELSGSLRLHGGSSALNGATALTGNLAVQGGAQLIAPGVTAVPQGPDYEWRVWEATGVGSLISMPSLTAVSLEAYNATLRLKATDSGQVSLAALSSIAYGAGAPSLTVEARTGGQTDLGGLGSPVERLNLIYESNGGIDLPGSLAMVKSSITLYGPDTPSDFGFLTSFEGNLLVQTGAQLIAPGVTAVPQGPDYVTRVWEASGVGSLISMPNLVAVSLEAYNATLRLKATDSGQVSLAALSSIAYGAGAPSLTVEARTGGQTDLGGLGSPVERLNLIYESNGGIDLPGSLAMVKSSITLYGPDTPSDFGFLTSFEGNILVQGGAQLIAPGVTAVPQGPDYEWREWHASGAGSLISMPNLTALSLEGYLARLRLKATESGQVSLPGLATVAYGEGGPSLIAEARTGGQVDLSGLASPVERLNLIYESNGAIALPESLAMVNSSITLYGPDTPSDLPNLTYLDGSVHVYDGATFEASGLTSLSLAADLYLHAQGTGSQIDLPGLTSVATDPGVRFRARAEGEGTISVPNAIAALGLLVDLTADGLNSLVDVSTFAVHRLNAGSVLNGINGGVILIQQDNRPPVATDDEAAALAGHVLELNPAKLLLNDVDPDGDTLSLTLPSGTTAQGGTVVLVSGRVHYTSPASYAGPDSFDYMAHDGFGGSDSATVVVNVRSDNRQSANLVSLTSGPDGCHGRMVCVPGRTYRIEVSTDLTVWEPLPGDDEFSAGPNGMFEFLDTGAAGESCRFYRLGQP